MTRLHASDTMGTTKSRANISGLGHPRITAAAPFPLCLFGEHRSPLATTATPPCPPSTPDNSTPDQKSFLIPTTKAVSPGREGGATAGVLGCSGAVSVSDSSPSGSFAAKATTKSPALFDVASGSSSSAAAAYRRRENPSIGLGMSSPNTIDSPPAMDVKLGATSEGAKCLDAAVLFAVPAMPNMAAAPAAALAADPAADPPVVAPVVMDAMAAMDAPAATAPLADATATPTASSRATTPGSRHRTVTSAADAGTPLEAPIMPVTVSAPETGENAILISLAPSPVSATVAKKACSARAVRCTASTWETQGPDMWPLTDAGSRETRSEKDRRIVTEDEHKG